MSKLGARTKLVPEVVAEIVKAVAAGNPLKFSAESAGVTERVVMKWMSVGRKGHSAEHVQFLQQIKKAQSDSVKLRVGRITKAGRRTWQANAWWLERMHPDHFGTDKKLVAQLLDQVTSLKSQLDSIHADAGRTRRRRKTATKKGKPRTVKGDGEGI